MPGTSTLAALSVAFSLASMELASMALGSPAAIGASVARPAKLGPCVACHGEAGRGRIAGTPHLAGQDEAYLRTALAAYRSGGRKSAPMNAIAGTLQPRDIATLARWY